MNVQRSICDIEREVVDQILISELCLDVCNEVPVVSGSGADFLPYFYNLNFSKAAISLHSLLLSKSPNEISIKNYISHYKQKHPTEDIAIFEKEIEKTRQSFEYIFPDALRHKIFAHLDGQYKHGDFMVAYVEPKLLKKYITVVENLKKCFFDSVNHARGDYPYDKILEQSCLFIKQTQDSDEGCEL